MVVDEKSRGFSFRLLRSRFRSSCEPSSLLLSSPASSSSTPLSTPLHTPLPPSSCPRPPSTASRSKPFPGGTTCPFRSSSPFQRQLVSSSSSSLVPIPTNPTTSAMDSTTLTRGGLRRTRKAKRDDVQCPSTPACDCAPGWNCVATARSVLCPSVFRSWCRLGWERKRVQKSCETRQRA